MKIQQSNQKINPFGGLNFVNHSIEQSGVIQLIDQELGNRPPQADYSYSDVFKSMWLLALSGADCAEDITEHFKSVLSNIPNTKVPGADTILRVQKSLSTEKETIVSASGTTHQMNVNTSLNRLNLKIAKHLGLLNQQTQDYVLDYDNQFQPQEKCDAKKSYKMKRGYFPGISSIGNLPVYLEHRNGNSNVKFQQSLTLKRCYDLLAEEGITIDKSRMDCGSFAKDIVEVVEANCNKFYIRAQRCEDLKECLRQIPQEERQQVEIGYKHYQICSLQYTPFGQDKAYRYVVSREKNNTGQVDLFTGDDFTYRAIMTNDEETSDLGVIEFYNDRAESEVLFDVMNNDFWWNKQPFSFLEENTVFLLIMAMCKNIYTWLLKSYSKKLAFLKPNYRLKKFIFRFITLPAKWIKRGRQQILKIFTSKPYHLLLE